MIFQAVGGKGTGVQRGSRLLPEIAKSDVNTQQDGAGSTTGMGKGQSR